MARLTVYDISRNRDRYPEHARVLYSRYKHVKNRLRSRYDVNVGWREFLRLSEICGRATAQWLNRPGHRYQIRPDHGLASVSNPKYSIVLVCHGKKMRAVYDAFDMMLLTVVPFDGYHIHPAIVVTDCGAVMFEDGRWRILEDVR